MHTAMEEDTGVRKLVELIFGKKPTIPEEMLAHSPIPSDVLTDSSKKMKDILRMHKFIMYEKWINYFDLFHREMLSSHQKYLYGLLYICLYEHKSSRNIFDSFISAFVLVMNISNEVFTKARIDFRDLNPDVIMVLYRNILKSSFIELGGFYRFVEYVRGHKYFEWNWNENVLNLSDSDTAFDHFRPDLDENIVKEYNSYLDFKGPSNDTIIAMAETAMRMAQEVLSTTSVDLPALLEPDLIKSLVASRKRQLATKTGGNRKAVSSSTFETAHGDFRSNSVSKTNYDAEQQENSISWHENVIQAVIRHNRCNVFQHGNVKNPKQVEAERTLEHLKTSIEFLIEVVDECNKG